MNIGIDRIGGTAYPNNVGRVDDTPAAVRQPSAQSGRWADANLTISESPLTKSAAELGFEAEPTRNDELTSILAGYAYPPPEMGEWLSGVCRC